MRVDFNTNIYSSKLNTKRNTKKANSFSNSQTFQSKENLKRTTALVSAALMLASIGAPMASKIETEPVGIYSQNEEKNEAFEKMQKIAQRLFEIDFEIKVLDAKIEKTRKADSENLEKQSKLYEMLDIEREKDDEEQNKIRRKIGELQEEHFKLTNQWAGILDSERSILIGTKTWLEEELYRLQGIKTGSGSSNVPMPYSKEHYAYDDPETLKAIDESKKNGFYIEFEYDTLSECENATESGIVAQLLEYSKDCKRLKPKADEYLKKLEFFRTKFGSKIAQISDVLERTKQYSEENGINPYDKSKVPDDLKTELKTLQDERDEILKDWQTACTDEDKAQYEEYINLLLKITVLESKLQELRS